MEADTASLRKAAPHWSLAGDKELLDMLQKIHQKIMTKCEEANSKLEIMIDALDNASIDLQNVNNKFMALSNSQFVESRVYDDDVDISTEGNTSKIEAPQVVVESETARLKRSLQRLEQMHEPVHILDSDSSDDDDIGRIILKPKEVYSHRPLPYIIGSQAWKSKWHAGLIQEESDSDSSVSKHDNIPAEEYSDSEPETAPTDKLANRTMSSSSFESEVTLPPKATSQATKQPAKPADIAAELARRLGGPLQMPASEPVPIESPPEPTTTKVYRMEKPAPTTVFSDEPPPLDDYQSYKSDYTDEDDIFAELHKKANVNTNRDHSRVANDLFGGLDGGIADELFGGVQTRDGDIGNVFDNQDLNSNTSARQTPPATSMFNEQEESNPITETLLPKPQSTDTDIDTGGAVKKPVGGISLFGTNKGAESIGAAILKRNIRKSSTSDEDTSSASKINEKLTDMTSNKEEPMNKIIEDLFSKPSKNVTKKEDTARKEESEKVKPVKDKIDLFSDNLFDDIDDIFTTNIVTKPKDNKPQKSIFDDDDLFADIITKKPAKRNDESDTKSIFDSNDDLFSESEKKLKTEVKIPSNRINVNKEVLVTGKNTGMNTKGNQKGLFDDDSEDDLFSDVKLVKESSIRPKLSVEKVTETENHTEHSDNKSPKVETVNNDVNKLLNTSSERKSLLNPGISQSNRKVEKSKVESSLLFDDGEFDDLFTARTNSSIKENKTVTEDNRHNKTYIFNKSIEDEDELQTCEDISETKKTILKQNMQSEIEVLESQSDKTLKDNLVDAEVNNSCIQDERIKSEISQPKGNLTASDIDVIYNILDEKENSKTSYLTDAHNVTNEPDYSKNSELLYEDLKDIPPPETIPDKETLESNDQGTFSDIFPDMPPAFEKPLEPKKSKNVNALFDDDSDDESLFFKKNEAISDEKPDLSFSSDRFRIFHDEPPEIDIDFSQKTLKNDQSVRKELPDDDLFADLTKTQAQNEKVLKENTIQVNDSWKNIYVGEEKKVTNVIDITKLIEDTKRLSESDQNTNVSKLLESFEDKMKTESSEHMSKTPEVKDTESIDDIFEGTEPKKSIGKLKGMNLNINVNTLLPGASLKKSKSTEETDGQAISRKSNEDLNIHSPEKTDSKMVKSISFDEDPESEVLDNKLSKQRAKIQVKRRPSSRRARLEAVRKSRIDLVSDSTDNSSSFDEPPYKEIIDKVRVEDKIDTPIILEKSGIDNLKGNTTSAVDKTITDVNIKPPFSESQQKLTDLIGTKTTQADVKSKIVYILNDEDIFNDIIPRQVDNTESKIAHNKKVLDIIDDDDELLFKTPNISTLGKAYEKMNVSSSNEVKSTVEIESLTTVAKQTNENKLKSSGFVKDNVTKAKKSIFDDLSDDEEELFGSKKPEIQKTSTFVSDGEGELFVKNKRDTKTPVVATKEAEVKGSLFGDESDDDDLFGVKPSNQSGNLKQNMPKPKEVTAKTSEPVFEDPLSMFGDG